MMRRFFSSCRGNALIEFALALPILLFLSYVLFEFTSFQLAKVKVDKAAFMIGNAVTQLPVEAVKQGGATYGRIDGKLVQDLLERVDGLVPKGSRGGVKVVVSAFTYVDHYYPVGASRPKTMDAPILLWARGKLYGNNPDGSLSTVRRLGRGVQWNSSIKMQKVEFIDADTLAALKPPYSNFECLKGEPEFVVLTEVFYDYKPIFANLVKGKDPRVNFLKRTTMVSRSFLRPRALVPPEALKDDAAFAQPHQDYLYSKGKINGFCE